MYIRHLSRILIIPCFTILLCLTLFPITSSGQDNSQWVAFIEGTLKTAYAIVHTENQEFSPELHATLQENLKILESQWVMFKQGGVCPSEEECQTFQYIIANSQRLVNYPQGAEYTQKEWEALATLRQVLNFYGFDSPQATPSSNPSKLDNSIPLVVQYQYRSGPVGEFKMLEDNDVMRSGDQYQIRFAAEELCYVYLFQVDASGKMFGLFPLERFHDTTFALKNPVQPNTMYIVPSPNDAFVLDKQTGEETVYLLAFREPQPKLEQLHEQMVAAQNKGNPAREKEVKLALLDQFHSKGVAGTAPIQSQQTPKPPAADSSPVSLDGDIVSVMQQRLDMCDGCVHSLTFQHK